MKYLFKCRSCKKPFQFELSVVQYTRMKTFLCPFCESDKVTRVISVPVIVFKGTGFYTTDVRKDESTGGIG